MMDPTRRFSDRVSAYVKHRPSYPAEIIDLLKARCGLEPKALVADIGSGTGQLAKLFLASGNTVIGIEPDRKMREAGARMLQNYRRFKSIAGRAESTALADHCVDFVTAGQAFHWFNPAQARIELRRILKPHGWVVLVWNVMQPASSAFQKAYHRLLLTFGTNYAAIYKSHGDPAAIRAFFGSASVNLQTFAHRQDLDYEGLKGRLLSSSFIPQSGKPRHSEMLRELKAIFDAHHKQRKVALHYDTKVFYAQISARV